MKNIILNKKDALLLEEVIARYGRIVSSAQLKRIFAHNYALAEAKNRISLLAKIGWLSRIKRGLYTVITDLGLLGTSDVSAYTIAYALNNRSYISFENALQYHGIFNQALSSVGAVTYQRARAYRVKETAIKFFKIKKKLYFGFTAERADIGLVNIAEKEKAVLDIIYFRSDAYHAGLIWEKLKEYKNDFDFNKLKRYASKFGLDIIRQTGFLLERLNVDTADLEKLLKGKTSYSRMTKDSQSFSAKWRLYFDDSIIK